MRSRRGLGEFLVRYRRGLGEVLVMSRRGFSEGGLASGLQPDSPTDRLILPLAALNLLIDGTNSVR